MSLYNKLKSSASAPDGYFNDIAIGEIRTYSNQLRKNIKLLSTGKANSRFQLIIGKNGNGKTLLQKHLIDYINQLNTENENKLNIFYSRVNASNINENQIPYQMVKNLSHSSKISSTYTFSTISSGLISNFIENYKIPWTRAFMFFPIKYFLLNRVRKYKEILEDFITSDEVDPIVAGLNNAFMRFQKYLNGERLKREYRNYVETLGFVNILSDYFLRNEGAPMSIQEINTNLKNDLIREGIHDGVSVIDMIQKLVNEIKTKLVVFFIDDANKITPSFLLSTIDKLSSFNSPKILIVYSCTEEKWANIIANQINDLSIEEKFDLYGNKKILQSPNSQELEQLFITLYRLKNVSLEEENKNLPLDSINKPELLSRCVGLSYRKATKEIIEELENAAHNNA